MMCEYKGNITTSPCSGKRKIKADHLSISSGYSTVETGGGLGRANLLGNFQYRGVLIIRIMVGQMPTVFAIGAGWDYLTDFVSFFLSLLRNRFDVD